MTTSRENHRIKYGAEHQRRRAMLKPYVELGMMECAYPGCGKRIEPGTKWDLGHRYAPNGTPLESLPMHASCNRNTSHSDKERDTGRFNQGATDNGPRTSRKWGAGS